jgi:hypothetical protein
VIKHPQISHQEGTPRVQKKRGVSFRVPLGRDWRHISSGKYAQMWPVMDGGSQMANSLRSGGQSREKREREREIEKERKKSMGWIGVFQ